jgi:hypothetical protein
LAIVGARDVAVKTAHTFWPLSRDEHAEKGVASPDGRYKATKFIYAEGGAIAPYCYERVAIVDAALSDTDAADKKYQVYWSECNSSPPLIVEWTSNRNLRITASFIATILDAKEILAKGRDSTLAVRVEVVILPFQGITERP